MVSRSAGFSTSARFNLRNSVKARKVTQMGDRIILVFLCFALPAFFGCREQKVREQDGQDSYAELTRLLDSAITKDAKNGTLIIEYCPENTCESFSMPGKHPPEKLNDFAFLYLYFVSDYYYLDEFRKRVAPDRITEIIERNKRSTLRNERLQDVKDIIESLAMEYSIKVAFVRYDESKRNEFAIDIKSELRKMKKR